MIFYVYGGLDLLIYISVLSCEFKSLYILLEWKKYISYRIPCGLCLIFKSSGPLITRSKYKSNKKLNAAGKLKKM